LPLLYWGTALLTAGPLTAGMFTALVAYAVAVAFTLWGLRSYPHNAIGPCNLVTLFRVVLVCALIGFVVSPAAGPWLVFAVASVALALDGVDGWLARRFGHASKFGASFDMEVDAVLAMTLALLGYFGGQAGVLVLLLGVPRYLFWAAQMLLPWLEGPLPERFSRKLVCVVQIAVLIAILLPVTGPPLTDIVAGFTVLALIWSFGLDIRLLWRARA